jgi:hypothetical protein
MAATISLSYDINKTKYGQTYIQGIVENILLKVSSSRND